MWRIPALYSNSKRVRSVPLNASALQVLDRLDTEGGHEYSLYLTILISTFASPSSRLAICEKAALDRSMTRPFTNGPRSLILTLTDLPLLIFMTMTSVPKGKVLWAAVIARLSKRSPLAVFRL